ncbi:RNA polymerase sigma factor [Formosa sp. S-31]|uniref:RNA polymerase sigma factor n=1 Tax=Formosa sp. S-31 TaxID=2790949 RepID=UPI003EBAD037
MSDLELVVAIAKNDKTAFKTLFERYYQRINTYVFTFVHDNEKANDIAQQVFVKLWEQRERMSSISSPRSYLYSIAYNIYVDDYRGLKREQLFLEELQRRSLAAQIEVNDELTQARIKKLKAVIDTLPKRCKEVLLLNKIEGLKYKEIAEQLDISVHTVNAQMQNAFAKIKEAFANDESIFLLILKW